MLKHLEFLRVLLAGCALAAGSSWNMALAEGPTWKDSVSFYASFDKTADAQIARGDQKIYTSPNLERKSSKPGLSSAVTLDDQGRWGRCLKFGQKTEEVVFFRGTKNVAFDAKSLNGSVSLWMKLDPNKDLAPGYVDPLQITDKAWNNSCLFLDFTDDKAARKFRLGVFSDYKFWNPKDIQWDNLPDSDRPMIVADKPGFSSDAWTHVAFTWSQFNTGSDGEALLYLNGEALPVFRSPQQYTWDPEKVVVILGIYYTGRIDDFAVFDRALTGEEVKQLSSNSQSIADQLSR